MKEQWTDYCDDQPASLFTLCRQVLAQVTSEITGNNFAHIIDPLLLCRKLQLCWKLFGNFSIVINWNFWTFWPKFWVTVELNCTVEPIVALKLHVKCMGPTLSGCHSVGSPGFWMKFGVILDLLEHYHHPRERELVKPIWFWGLKWPKTEMSIYILGQSGCKIWLFPSSVN